MVRKLALAVSLALGTVSVPAHALGLGDINSKSLLNQNFQGEIQLMSVQPDELDTIRVQLGEADAFERAGIERPFYLSLLKFETQLSERGQPIIRVTSEFPIREPFLNFLIEVNWPKGRLLREYTVLLDPPTTTSRRPPSVAPAPRASRPASATAARPAPVAVAPAAVSGLAADASEYGPVKANDTAWSLAKQLRPRGVSMEQMMMALLDANPQAFIDGNINRLRRGQILRVPALEEIQQLSRQQARTAYRQQQDAWLARRDQKLQQVAEEQAGDTVAAAEDPPVATDTPDKLLIATARPDGEGEAGAGDDDAVSPTADGLQSRLIVARENAETSRQEAETLRSRVDDLQSRLADMQKLLSLKDEQLAQLQDRVVSEEFLAEPEVTDTVAETEQATPAPDAALAEDYRIQDIPPQIDPDRIVEAAGSVVAVGVSETGQSDLADVPKQVDPDRIVALWDADNVAAEGVPNDGLAEQTAQDLTEPVVEAAVTESVIAETPLPVGEVESAVVETEIALAELESPAAETDPAALEPIAPETVIEIDGPMVGEIESATGPASSELEPATEVTDPADSEPVAVEPEPAEAAASDSQPASPIAAMLQQNMVPIAAGGVGLLGLVGWLVSRRRRRDEGPDAPLVTEAVAADPLAPALSQVDASMPDAEAMSELRDSAFLDEFSPSDINALQDETGEVDPVSEADVYIAYGRYQQAEDLLRQAMEREPDRLALKHKLLEVHYATRNAEAFVAVAQQMVDAGQDAADEEAWVRAQDMGRELASDNPLFALEEGEAAVGFRMAAGGMAAAGAGAGAASVDDDTLTLDDAELSELTAAYDEEPTAANDLEAPSEVSITLDLDDSIDAASQAPNGLHDSIATSELASMEFEMPESDRGDAATYAAAAEQHGGDSMDLDSMLAEAESVIDREDSLVSLDSDFSPDDLQAQLDELSDLSMFDSDLDDPAEPAAGAASSGLGLVAEDSGSGDAAGLDEPLNLDTAFDMAEEDEEAARSPELVEAGADGGLESDDDIETKLDLARAYVDMGDQDGARSILEEVVVEGSDTQRDDAEQLLASLG